LLLEIISTHANPAKPASLVPTKQVPLAFLGSWINLHGVKREFKSFYVFACLIYARYGVSIQIVAAPDAPTGSDRKRRWLSTEPRKIGSIHPAFSAAILGRCNNEYKVAAAVHRIEPINDHTTI
jgi:hypothetical protein